MSKLILIEGTDCSGKETQTKEVIKKLTKEGIKAIYFSFPCYDTPTGRIIGGPYLGKPSIGESFFPEGAASVPAKVASLYFGADRLYNIEKVKKLINEGYNVFLDRYVYSNMAHQGGKILDQSERHKMYKWIDTLEFGLLELPKIDLILFLHMPYEQACELKKTRQELPDGHESSEEHLKNAEKAYLELASIYDFKKIECTKDNKLRTIEDINNEVYNIIKENL